jgi:hypothetical protein
VEHAGRPNFVHERRHAQALRSLLAGGEPHLGQRALHEILQTYQTSAEHRSGTAVDGDRASFQRVESEERAVEEVPQLVRRLAEALDFLSRPFQF